MNFGSAGVGFIAVLGGTFYACMNSETDILKASLPDDGGEETSVEFTGVPRDGETAAVWGFPYLMAATSLANNPTTGQPLQFIPEVPVAKIPKLEIQTCGEC